ncbi:hypothetical protein H1R85_07355, partial [Flavobacterium psychrophilum]
MIENNKLIANPSDLQIGTSIFGMLFFPIIAFYINTTEWGKQNQANENVIILVFTIFFSFLALLSLYLLLSSKKVELTNETLLITYPYIRKIQTIDFKDIRKVIEDNHNIEGRQSFRKIELYNGRKITIEFFKAKKIVITSFEVTNYNLLAINLKNITKSYYKLKIENQNIKNTQNYGCIIFVVILILAII